MKSLICWSVTCRPAKELVLSKEKPIPYQPPLPPNEAPSGIDAAAGVTPVGLRPPFVTPAAAHSHPDCRGIPILIVAPHLNQAPCLLLPCESPLDGPPSGPFGRVFVGLKVNALRVRVGPS